MHNESRNKLREIVRRDGSLLQDDPQRIVGLLKDACPQYKRETSALIAALKERVPYDLAKQSHVPQEMLFRQLTRRLCDDLAMDKEAARWAVESWAMALGLLQSTTDRIAEMPEHGADRSVLWIVGVFAICICLVVCITVFVSVQRKDHKTAFAVPITAPLSSQTPVPGPIATPFQTSAGSAPASGDTDTPAVVNSPPPVKPGPDNDSIAIVPDKPPSGFGDRSQTPIRGDFQNNEKELYKETRTRILSVDEVREWPPEKLQDAISEMYARYGYGFHDSYNSQARAKFGQLGYKPIPGRSDREIEDLLFTKTEQKNFATLVDTRDAAWLGISIGSVPPDVADQFSIGADIGVSVMSVRSNSPASRTDLSEGDIILSIDGQETHNLHDVAEAIRPHKEHPMGETVRVHILCPHDKAEHDVDVTMAGKPRTKTDGAQALQPGE